MRSLPHAHLMKELRAKELGLVAHLLDGVVSEAPRAAVVTAGLGAGLMQFEGGFAPYIVLTSLLIGQVVSLAQGFSNFLEARHNARTFDAPRVQAYLSRMNDSARDFMIAAQRGTAWIIINPAVEGLEVMSEMEYQKFREKTLASNTAVNEIRIVRRKISNTRIRAGHVHVPEERRIADVSLAFGTPRYSASRFLAMGSGMTEETQVGT